jgi:hypothetical protein
MRPPRAVIAVTVLMIAALGTGCSDPASAGPSTAAVEWATEVCGALGPWRSEITDLNQQAQLRISGASSPEQARAGLLELLAGAESATADAHAAVAAAGTPDVPGGADVARSFTTSLDAARIAYGQARTDVQALATADERAFYDGVVAVLGRLTEQYAAAGVDTSALDSP